MFWIPVFEFFTLFPLGFLLFSFTISFLFAVVYQYGVMMLEVFLDIYVLSCECWLMTSILNLRQ